MSIRKRLPSPQLVLATGALMLGCAAAGAVVPAVATAGPRSATFSCSQLGLPSGTHTISIAGKVNITLTTCDAAQAPGIGGCGQHTISVPGVVNVNVYLCFPPSTRA
jgi:hypothetical protein